MDKKLSFIIPLYNVEGFIARCLDTLVAQDLAPEEYEILIVDDGSKDNSAAIVKEYQKQYSQIKYIYQTNKGQAAARNLGIRSAQGKYVCFVDADDFVRKYVFGRMLEVATQNELDVLMYQFVSGSETTFPDINIAADSCEILGIYKGSDYIAEYDYTNSCWYYLLELDFLKASSVFFKEGIYLEDVLFTTQILLEARRAARIQVSAYYYYLRNGSTMHNKDGAHINRLLNDYFQVSLMLKSTLENKRASISEKCWNVVNSHKNNLIFFMLVKMLRMRVGKTNARKFIALLEEHKMYPFSPPRINGQFKMIHYLIYRVLINKRLFLFLNSIYK